jgi:type II secretory pathway component PulF
MLRPLSEEKNFTQHNNNKENTIFLLQQLVNLVEQGLPLYKSFVHL